MPDADERPNITARFVDEAGRVAAHVPCVACGYDLLGQTAAGACSECGAGVSESLDERRLIFRPNLLRRLQRPLQVSTIATICSGLPLLVLTVVPMGLCCVLPFFGLGILVHGLAWRDLRSQISFHHAALKRRASHTVKWLTVLLVAVMCFVAGGLIFVQSPDFYLRSWTFVVGTVLMVLSAVSIFAALFAHQFGIAGFAQALARELGLPRLERSAKALRWTIGIALLGHLFFLVYLLSILNAPQGPALGPVLLLAVAAGANWIALIITLHRASRGVTRSLRQRDQWVASDAPDLGDLHRLS